MGDDHDGFAVIPHTFDHLKQFLRFLRRQNGGRLVQNQDLRSAVERFYNL